jgi:hypothetical protein
MGSVAAGLGIRRWLRELRFSAVSCGAVRSTAGYEYVLRVSYVLDVHVCALRTKESARDTSGRLCMRRRLSQKRAGEREREREKR